MIRNERVLASGIKKSWSNKSCIARYSEFDLAVIFTVYSNNVVTMHQRNITMQMKVLESSLVRTSLNTCKTA